MQPRGLKTWQTRDFVLPDAIANTPTTNSTDDMICKLTLPVLRPANEYIPMWTSSGLQPAHACHSPGISLDLGDEAPSRPLRRPLPVHDSSRWLPWTEETLPLCPPGLHVQKAPRNDANTGTLRPHPQRCTVALLDQD